MKKEELWLLNEKYRGEKTVPVFDESPEEIKDKYPWGEVFFADCARLKNGEPLAYVIGHVPFLNVTIYLDSHPLIPRTETEFWTQKIIQKIQDEKPDAHVLDLCAGSGCIGVAILRALPHTRVDFVEIDVKHHATILKNVRENNIDSSRTHIIESDLFKDVRKVYDYIVCNPPYIDPTIDRTETSVREHEPHNALYGGKDGLELITHIIQNAKEHLTHSGALVIEHEPEQALSISNEAETAGFATETFNDQFNLARFTVLTRITRESMAP